jgi:dephospho-CoA kinase
MSVIVAVVGMCGSGKSVVSDMLVRKGFQYLRFGQITLDEVKRRGLSPTEENERPIREEFRRKHGMGAYATLNIPKFDELLTKGDVVGDGLYSWSEYKVLKERYGDRLVVLCVYAPPQTRYGRLDTRVLAKEDVALRHRRIAPAEAKARDYAEIEHIEKGGPIAMADYLIRNEEMKQELEREVGRFLKGLGR